MLRTGTAATNKRRRPSLAGVSRHIEPAAGRYHGKTNHPLGSVEARPDFRKVRRHNGAVAPPSPAHRAGVSRGKRKVRPPSLGGFVSSTRPVPDSEPRSDRTHDQRMPR